MHTPICDELGIEFPIFAFTHCRDVVAAVSKAGGFGVLGAVGFTPEQLEIELNWIDEHIGDQALRRRHRHPRQVRGHGREPVRRGADQDAASDGAAGAPRLRHARSSPTTASRLDRQRREALQLLGWTEATATPQVEVALQHPKVTLIANALGTPPDGRDRAHPRPRAARSPRCAARRTRRASTRTPASTSSSPRAARAAATPARSARSCCGRRWSRRSRRFPVLAAGGIGSGQQIAAALALGAQGVWTGSLWLTVEEAENTPAQQQRYSRRPAATPCAAARSPASRPHAAQRLDRGLGEPGQPEAARHAAAVHGVRDGGRRPRTSTPTRPSTSRSTRSARSSAS